MHRRIPAKRVIDRFIEYHRRPFRVVDVANDTGIHPKTVRNLMPKFVAEERVKVLLKEKDGTIYIKTQPTHQTDNYSGKQYDWKPKIEKLKAVYEAINGCVYAADLARKLRWSKESAARYFRILRIEGCIQWSKADRCYKQAEFNPEIRWYSEYIEKEEQRLKSQRVSRNVRKPQVIEKEIRPDSIFVRFAWFQTGL